MRSMRAVLNAARSTGNCASRAYRRGTAAALASRGGQASLREAHSAAAAAVRYSKELPDCADAEDFVRVYGAAPTAEISKRLAVVKIGGEILQKQLAELVENVAYMQSIGMDVVLVHGAGPQLNEELEAKQVEPTYVGGHRVTDADTLAIAERVFNACNAQLVSALEAAGVAAQGFAGNALHAEVADGGNLGFVGEITGLEVGSITAALEAGRVPVLNSLAQNTGSDGSSGFLNVNADVVAREVARATKPLRVVFLSAGGGWKEDGAIVPELSMATDFERLEAMDYTGRQGTLLKLREVKAITDALPSSSSVVICAPKDLTRQLVPHRGPGTQIRRGARAALLTPGAVDQGQLTGALSAAHGRPTTAAALAGRHGAQVRAVVATPGYSAVAVVTETHLPATSPVGQSSDAPFSVPRLSALVCTGAALDSGEERAVWTALQAEFPELWWAARPSSDTTGATNSAATPVSSAKDSHRDCLTHDRVARYAGGCVRLALDAKPVTLDGLSQEEQLQLVMRASSGGAVDANGQIVPPETFESDLLGEGLFLPSGGGSPASTSARAYPTLMWSGLTGLFEAEEAVQTAQRARARAARIALSVSTGSSDGAVSAYETHALAAFSPAHPADDVSLIFADDDAGASPSNATTESPAQSTTVAASSSSDELNVCLIGARGHTGRELVTLISQHPRFRIIAASSRAFAGQTVASALGMEQLVADEACTPGLQFQAIGADAIEAGTAMPDGTKVDAFVLALPNGFCDEYVTAIKAAYPEATVVDLSADKRFDSTWAYGMPERPGAREVIQSSRYIANPGCYATGVQVGLMPFAQSTKPVDSDGWSGDNTLSCLLDASHIPSAFGISGYSGAGVNPSDKNDPLKLRDNLLPYALVGHIHEREATRHLGRQVAFSPMVAPFFRGISLTLSGVVNNKDALVDAARSRTEADGLSPSAAVAALAFAQAQEYFADSPLVRVTPDEINVRDHGSNTTGVTLGSFSFDVPTGRLAWVSCLDNLGKGAAVQAVQNLNLSLGLEELEGIVVDTPFERR